MGKIEKQALSYLIYQDRDQCESQPKSAKVGVDRMTMI